ncbi:arylsulfatase A-like enzyme [Lutibacter sp. Hel_I_33_5]|uniref:sulfatase-like hydrolase/transferase n=1 Tax=Lutibacter sp. Hel_I_33_5 TaxID=1566289 RepID=UPI0011A152DA|nr:sulfatase-like hydrolase/transferase [Lutibacter sp. Hel_I_33_5]TVZ55310.1 arylsulfatase A-like enzyme [Lutibacter sp. Hel_I_33_5]
MKKYIFLIGFLMVFGCSSSQVTETEEVIEEIVVTKKPNILLIIADDMGLDATPNYSEGTIKPNMTNLQSLMNDGITFENFWSYPVCTPTRAAILTGKYGIKTDVIEVGDEISTSETSIQKYIDTNTNDEYASAMIGKWHLSVDGADALTMGIDYYAGIINGGVPSYTNWNFYENGTTTNSTEYTTTKFTDLAIDWIDKQTKPWFLWMGYNAPHTPFHLAPTNLHSQGSLPTDDASIAANPMPYYMSAIEVLDSEIGRLINSMSAEEKANTVIIFIGDNGTPNKVSQAPYGRTRAKGSLYQGGINVPLVVSGAGVTKKGSREDALIHATDIYNTVGNIAGINSSTINNSTSFYELFSGTSSNEREYVYAETTNDYTIRNNTYKLLVFSDGSEEFYNLSTDSYENTNLIGTTLSSEATKAKTALKIEADKIRM